MATSRTHPPPVNLRERIAALQQRNVSPSQQQASQFAAKNLPSSGTGCLRDRIAKFEEKGGIPVPRGSFGMGGPQLAENAPAKKRGELYGNRVQGLGRQGGTPSSRSGSPLPPADDSPLPRKRCVSTGGALLKGTPPRFATDEPIPIPPLPPTPSPPSARRNSLAVDFGPTESVISSREVSQRADEDSESPSPSPSTSPSLGVGGTSGIITPSQSLEPATPSEDAPLQDMDALSQLEQDSAVTGHPPQADPDLVPAIALDLVTSSQSSPEVVTVVEVTSAVEPDQIIDPVSDEQSKTSYHLPPSVDASVTDAQPSEATLPDSSSTILPSFVAPNAATQRDSALTHPTAANDKDYDDAAKPVLISESPPADERGTISISVPHPRIQVQPSPPSPDLDVETTKVEGKRSFTAVVHRKVTEMPAATAPTSTLSAPITPQVARVRRTGITISAEPLSSPGYGELAILLEEAALLEMKLTEGDSYTPSEPVEAALPKTPANDAFATDVRFASLSTLTELVEAPSTETASLSERSISIPSIREPTIDGDIPEEDEGDGRSLASTSASQRSPSHKRYLSSIRRLTGRRSSNYMPGAYPRDSISTCSEDSAQITTPSDHGDGSGFGVAWPSVSPKKGGMGRSSSFADKLFNRNRTKSNVSTVETDQGSIYNSSKRSFALSPPPTPSPTKSSQGRHASELPGSRPSPWMVPRDSTSSPAPSILEKEIFDAFPSVPQTLPPGPLHLSPDLSGAAVRRLSTLPVKARKHPQQRLSMV